MAFRGLVLTVGGTPEPVRKAIEYEKPAFILFVVSADSRNSVETCILPKLSCTYVPQYQIMEISDHEHIGTCYQEIRKEVHKWLTDRNLDTTEVYADLTGGTKVMTAALALVAVDESIASITYVGGDRSGSEDRWVVVSGFERVVQTQNPLQAGAVREIDRANWLLDSFYADAAAETLNDARENSDASHKARLDVFISLAGALGDADRFQFGNKGDLRKFNRCRNTLEHTLDYTTYESLIRLSKHWAKIDNDVNVERKTPGRQTLLELLANAERRAEQARYDDAVGRLYRAVELYGQQLVKEAFGADLGKSRLEDFPADCHERARELLGEPQQDGKYQLGVKKLYSSLEFSANEEIRKQALIHNTLSDHLSVRNTSLLAHGLQPVSEKTFRAFWKDTLESINIDEKDIPRWPKLTLTLR